jgi:hypothetical protein
MACLGQTGKQHWSFLPVGNPEPPVVPGYDGKGNPIDQFILAKLQQGGPKPVQEATKSQLARRLYFDLLGLPPTFQLVQEFEGDPNPEAYNLLVEKLLASPHYGERWGRYWLDIVRYADTAGYLGAGKDRNFPYAYTYRDWVVRALNEDLPYDQFILRQLAADQIPGLPKPELAALGLLNVGSRFIERKELQIDDKIDVVTRGMMGLTVACTRCHDHFFDPLTQADYYSLYGIFDNSEEPDELPVIGTPPDTPEYRKYLEETGKRQADIDNFLQSKIDALQTQESIAAYLTLVDDGHGKSDEDFRAIADKRDLYYKVGLRWRKYLEGNNLDPFWKPWLQYMQEFPSSPENVLSQWPMPLQEAAPKDEGAYPPRNPQEMITLYARMVRDAYLTVGNHPLKGMAEDSNFPQSFSLDKIGKYIHRADSNELIKIQNKLASFIASSPQAPPRAMVVYDREKPRSQRIFLSGNRATLGDVVARQFIGTLQHLSPGKFPVEKSGRLEYAQAIVHPDNPLTARVIANRVWMYHFGKPLVPTPSDFGVQGIPPTHPELLDHLARYLVDHKWSLKALHRYILSSDAYKRTSLAPADERDPDNALLWRQNRRRMDFEAQRDAILAVCGKLDGRVGGHPEGIIKKPFSTRRTIYSKIDRSDLPGLFLNFDFPNPDIHSPKRAETTVPQQALYNMNSEFVQEMAANLAERADQGIPELFRTTYARNPSEKELQACQHFLESASFPQLAQALLMSNEFMFVD